MRFAHLSTRTRAWRGARRRAKCARARVVVVVVVVDLRRRGAASHHSWLTPMGERGRVTNSSPRPPPRPPPSTSRTRARDEAIRSSSAFATAEAGDASSTAVVLRVVDRRRPRASTAVVGHLARRRAVRCGRMRRRTARDGSVRVAPNDRSRQRERRGDRGRRGDRASARRSNVVGRRSRTANGERANGERRADARARARRRRRRSTSTEGVDVDRRRRAERGTLVESGF